MPKATKQPVAATTAKPKKVLVIKTGQVTPTPVTKSTKRSVLITLLKRSEGATLDDLMQATGWQRHSVRGAISGTLKKNLGLQITPTKETRGTVYRIPA